MRRNSIPTFVRVGSPFLAGAALAASTLGAEPTNNALGATDQTSQQLQQEIQDLRERLKALEAATPATQPASQSPEVGAFAATSERSTVDQVVEDAHRRSTPVFAAASGGFTAGYDKGFFIKSDDGNFLLKPAVQFQFRNVTNYQPDGKHDGNDESFQNGFEVRRARFRFDGNAFTQKFTYSFVWDTARTNGGVALLDAWAQYQFADHWAIKAGQFKESVFHERDVSGYQQLAVDRSLTDAVLGGNLTDRVQGVSLIFGGTKKDAVRAEVAYHDGANSKNTNFQDGTATHWGAGARGEYKLFGDWADYKDLTAKGGKKDLLIVGAGADYTDRVGSDVLLSTVDAQYEVADKLIIYGALHGDYTDPHESADNRSHFDWGALAQVGYLISKQVELFGRYDVVVLDDTAVAAGAEDTFHELTAGFNFYFGPGGAYVHRAKFTLDASYLPNGAPSDQTQAGILAASDDGFVVRAQFQLLL